MCLFSNHAYASFPNLILFRLVNYWLVLIYDLAVSGLLVCSVCFHMVRHKTLAFLPLISRLIPFFILVWGHVINHSKRNFVSSPLHRKDLSCHRWRGLSLVTQIKTEELRAIFSHCYGHSLQLAVGDMIKEVKNLKDALDTTSEISKLLKFSPKQKALFKKLKEDLVPGFPGLEYCVQPDGLSVVVLCRVLLTIGMYFKNYGTSV